MSLLKVKISICFHFVTQFCKKSLFHFLKTVINTRLLPIFLAATLQDRILSYYLIFQYHFAIIQHYYNATTKHYQAFLCHYNTAQATPLFVIQ